MWYRFHLVFFFIYVFRDFPTRLSVSSMSLTLALVFSPRRKSQPTMCPPLSDNFTLLSPFLGFLILNFFYALLLNPLPRPEGMTFCYHLLVFKALYLSFPFWGNHLSALTSPFHIYKCLNCLTFLRSLIYCGWCLLRFRSTLFFVLVMSCLGPYSSV